MSDWDGMVERIAALVGIDAGYTDAFGRQAWTPLETRRAILADFGLPTATEAEARDSLAHIETMREGVLVSNFGAGRLRVVTHYGVSAADCRRAVQVMQGVWEAAARQ